MAKAKKDKLKRQKKAREQARGTEPSGLRRFIEKHPDGTYSAILLVLLLVFFHEVIFGGKTFLPPDKLAARSVAPFIFDALKRGIYPLWNPYIFSGMPSFASLQSAPFVDLVGDVVQAAHWLVSRVLPLPEITRLLFNYFLFGIFTYILLLKKTSLRWVALLAAVVMVFQPAVIAFAAFGHSSKLKTAAMIPIVYLLLEQALDEKRARDFVLLALAVGLQLLRAHTQIAYYTFMMIGLYLLFWVADAGLQKRSFAEVGKALAGVVVALAVGVAMSAWLYLSVQEYAHYSIRGGGQGLSYGYATNWSFSPAEMTTFLVPAFMGFGGQTYWGQMPFTDFPWYMGVVPLFLAGAALVLRRDRTVLFFAALGLLSLLVSFGKTLPLLYGPLFKFLPFFNKFRVPSMILILLQFAVVMLAALGLERLLNLDEERLRDRARKYIYVFAGACAALALFLLLGKSVYLGWVQSSAKQLAAAAQEAAYKKAASDALKMMLMVGVSAVLVLSYLKKKLGSRVFLVATVSLVVLDLWLVDFKVIHPQPKANEATFFAETPAVKFLKAQSAPFRIYPVADDKPANWYMYHKIQNILGYHPAKLKIYQSFLEQSGLEARDRFGLPAFLGKYLKVTLKDGRPALAPVNPEDVPQIRFHVDNAILDMLNVKYLLSFYPIRDSRYQMVAAGQPAVYENTGVLPRAFFVNDIRVVARPEAFFDLLRSGRFDPHDQAVLEEEPAFNIVPSQENRVEIRSYDIHKITLHASVAEPALLVLSEIYYPAGWKAFVDGQETKIYKTDYILRSIFLKPGEHDIEFVFRPKTFWMGAGITFGLFVILLAFLFFDFRRRRAASAVSPPPV